MRAFYVFKRGKRKFYYVQFVNPITGCLMSARSTKQTDYQSALEESYRMLYTVPKVKTDISVVSGVQQAIRSNTLTQTDFAALQNLLGVSPIGYETASTTAEKPAIDIPVQITKTPLLQWLKDFWNYENSEYIQDKLSHGLRIGKRYCYDQTVLLKNWESFFDSEKSLEDLSIDDLQAFEKYLYEKTSYKKRTVVNEDGKKSVEVYESTLSSTTRNKIIKVGKTAFEWAVRKKIMLENPCKALTPYRIEPKERGILSRDEAQKLFTVGKWKDDRARIASLVAMTTGLRISEILALQSDDIGDDRLFITRSWTPGDGLKATKNGESRVVPLVPNVKAELLKLHLQNPHREKGDKFIFFGNLANKPVVANVITEDYRLALESIGISEPQRQKRNIVFHSWRHFYATTIATELSEKHAQLTLGHLTAAMTKHYADHKTEEALMSVCSASNEIFAQMLHA